MNNFLKKINPAFIVALILFIIPFFWLKAGEMDLGGDGTRLYFYDPLEFIKNAALYSVAPEGRGTVDSAKHAYLIYVGLLLLLKSFIHSSTILIDIFNGIKLAVGFISIYFIVRELLSVGQRSKREFRIEVASILAGLFYILATGSEKLIFFWVKALHSHDQIFLNPLIFLLLLKYFLTKNNWYLISFLFVSFIFSTNFALISSPAFFGFYPITILFLILYVVFIRKKKVANKNIFFTIIFFIGLQAFHLFTEVASLFDSDGIVNSVVFKESVSGGVNFFEAIRGEGKVSINLLLPSPLTLFSWTSFVAPIVIILGYIFSKNKSKEILLTSIFFFITLFLISVNITNIGYEIYRLLFYIPGFSMFRHFFVQWAFVFIFFYAILFGQALYIIFSRLKIRYVKILSFLIFTFFIIGFWSFLNGSLIDAIQWGSNGVRTAMSMDPKYEDTLDFIRKLPDEGKILIFPLTDNFNQVVFGTNNAAYVGPPTISFLTSKKSFAGYQNFDDYPYKMSEAILKFSRDKNYEALSQLFSFFNIRYIFYNSDPKIYEQKFPQFPNSYMMTSLPKTQAEYKEFLDHFPAKRIYKNGYFQVLEIDEKSYRREVYMPDVLIKTEMISTIENSKISYQSAFIDEAVCKTNSIVSSFCKRTYNPIKIKIEVKKINPTEYKIYIPQLENKSPFLLVFQNTYNKNWKLSLDGKNPLDEEKHIVVNKYANAWIITSLETKEKKNLTLSLYLETQKYFYYGSVITAFSFLVFLAFVIYTVFRKK